MSEWKAAWTGTYPCRCCGEWHLYRDGEEVDVKIPFNSYRDVDYSHAELYTAKELSLGYALVPCMGRPAYTSKGFLATRKVGEDGEYVREYRRDGMGQRDWISKNIDFLKQVVPVGERLSKTQRKNFGKVRKKEFGRIYRAFRSEDFRSCTCGGCM